MAEQPNDASRKSKAEGDRWTPDSEQISDRSDYQSPDERSGGISNRSLDEETSSQQDVPSRGQSKRRDRGDSDMDMDQDLDVESRRNEP
jgi:hypothetical protein